ncbi:MAG: response regulator transcription factor [Methylococcales bacterium]|nr:response regulator transcription factor [Methylococcales bacterium]MCK5925052.1 response regulator transcription factor [Methylococcales bacterium]
MKIKVLLVDDHAVVRAGFKLLLATSSTIEVVAEANCGEQVNYLCQRYQPDLIILDLSMPGIGGLETIRRITKYHKTINILVFSVHDESVYVNRALNAGAKGYITKNSAPEILTTAILKIQQGECYIEQGLVRKSSPSEPEYQKIIQTFSVREFDVFRLLAIGFTPHAIASELCLSYKTVANYATKIKKKLQISSIAELAHVAMILGIIKHK